MLAEDLIKEDYVSRGLNQGRLCKQRTYLRQVMLAEDLIEEVYVSRGLNQGRLCQQRIQKWEMMLLFDMRGYDSNIEGYFTDCSTL